MICNVCDCPFLPCFRHLLAARPSTQIEFLSNLPFMSWMRIQHATTYRYRCEVAFTPHRLVLRPREGHDIRVEEMRLEIHPRHAAEWSRDVFGNSVATVHFLAPANELRIASQVILRQTPPFPLPALRPSAPPPYPVEYAAEEEIVAAAYRTAVFPDDLPAVLNWLKDAVDLSSCPDAESVVASVNQQLKKTIGYTRREDKGVQTPGETLRKGTGSCRDVATLFLETLRVLGFPARFASGYLDCLASEVGRASMHAWTEAYLPHIGWVGYDQSLGEKTSDRHVVVGVSNHPRGVMPVTGAFYGTQDQFVEMAVSVFTERLEVSPLGNQS